MIPTTLPCPGCGKRDGELLDREARPWHAPCLLASALAADLVLAEARQQSGLLTMDLLRVARQAQSDADLLRNALDAEATLRLHCQATEHGPQARCASCALLRANLSRALTVAYPASMRSLEREGLASAQRSTPARQPARNGAVGPGRHVYRTRLSAAVSYVTRRVLAVIYGR